MANPLIVANLVALLKFGDFGWYGDFVECGTLSKSLYSWKSDLYGESVDCGKSVQYGESGDCAYAGISLKYSDSGEYGESRYSRKYGDYGDSGRFDILVNMA